MLKEKIKVTKIKVHKDSRGLLAKIFDYASLKGKDIQDIYVTITPPKESRADHYHKKTTEWFCAIKGKGIMKFNAIGTDEELKIEMDANNMSMIEVPPGINHLILAEGDEPLILMAFGNQPYKEGDADTYSL
jgi:dTDP-4-dehydrorhamnose 3,5-epimerase-like enzyme